MFLDDAKSEGNSRSYIYHLLKAINARVMSSKKDINQIVKNLNPNTMQVVLEVAVLIAIILVPLVPAKSRRVAK